MERGRERERERGKEGRVRERERMRGERGRGRGRGRGREGGGERKRGTERKRDLQWIEKERGKEKRERAERNIIEGRESLRSSPVPRKRTFSLNKKNQRPGSPHLASNGHNSPNHVTVVRSPQILTCQLPRTSYKLTAPL